MKQREKLENPSNRGGLIIRPLMFVVIIALIIPSLSNAQSGWSINSSIQMAQGNYITGISRDNYYFNIGSRYRSEGWYVSANISIIARDGLQSETNDHGMMGGSEISHLNMGIGDFYLFGEINLFNGTNILPWIALSSQIKIPTADPENFLGTGEFDYGIGLTFRKKLYSFIAFSDIGYLNLGDPKDITYLNPLTFGIGIGRGFDYGNYSISLYYQRYTKIYNAYAPPHQLSLGLYANLISNTFISIIGSKGLSQTSPDFSVSAGLEYYF